MSRFLRITIILLGTVLAIQAHAAECTRFEPALTELTGKLVLRDYPGPPNFERIEAGDQRETAWILVLDAPLCVDGDPTSEINTESVANVTEGQLVLTAESPSLTPFRERALQVSGRLFAAHSGYHRTPVLITVDSLSRKDAESK
jgi:hypothetical protein